MEQTRSGPIRQSRSARFWIGLGAALVLVAFLGLLLRGLLTQEPLTSASGRTREGKPAPDFALTDFDGQTVQLADLRGKGVVLNFWASWCEPCRDEATALNDAYAKYKDKGIAFVGVNFWSKQETEADARAFTQEYKVAYTLARDSDGNTSLNYGVSGIPVTFFIDASGTVVKRWVGPLDPAKLDSLISGISPHS